mgnify:CR=1 FL=1
MKDVAIPQTLIPVDEGVLWSIVGSIPMEKSSLEGLYVQSSTHTEQSWWEFVYVWRAALAADVHLHLKPGGVLISRAQSRLQHISFWVILGWK